MADEPVLRLIGRPKEQAQLHEAIEAAAGGAARLVYLEGEAGIGKSRLVDEALAEASAAGFQRFRGAADDLDRERPFAPLAEALGLDPRAPDAARGELGRLLYGVRASTEDGGTAGDLSFRITESILDLLDALASTGPIALAIEDLHWAEQSTIRTVHAVGKRLRHLPLLLILTARPLPRPPELDRAVEALVSAGGTTIALGPLDEAGVAELTGEIASAPPGKRLLSQIRGAGGNPLFVIELVRALRDEGAIVLEAGSAEVASEALPPSFRLTTLRRMSVLPEETLDILRLASVLGATFSLTELSLVASKSIVQLYASFQPAIGAGFIGESDDRLAFRHDLIRTAIYEDMPLAVRRGLHYEVGRALAQARVEAARVAEHFYLGAPPGDAEAVAWLRRAAREASTRSLVVARSWMERALEIAGSEDPERDSIVAELIPSLAVGGKPHEVEALAHEVLDRTNDPAVAVALRRGLAHVLSQRGAFAAAAEQTDLAAAIASIPPADRAEMLALGSMFKVFSGDPEVALAQAQTAMSAAAGATDEYAAFLALHTMALVAAARGEVAEAVKHGERIGSMESRMTTPWSGYLVSNLYRGAVLLDADRLQESEEAYYAGRRLAEERGGTPFLPVYQWSRARGKYFAGAFDDALAEIETGMALAEEMGQRWLILPYGILARIAIHRDDLAGASTSLADAERAFAEAGPQLGFDWMMWARALLLEAEGNVDAAAAVLSNAWAAFSPLRYLVAWRSIAPDLVRLSMAAGDEDRAREVTADAEEGARRGTVPSAEGCALRCRGLVERDAQTLLDAVGAYRKGPRPVDVAAACEDAGAALSRAGRADDGVQLLSEALEAFETLGASRDTARVAAVLRDLGVRRRRRSKRSSAAVGWEALTATERDVARLAAQGLTNRQIGARLYVSPRTVETHLSHVFQKLSLSTRVELAAEVTRLGAFA